MPGSAQAHRGVAGSPAPCPECGAALPTDPRTDQKWCSNQCKSRAGMRAWRQRHPDARAERRWRLAIALREARTLAALFGDALEEVSTVNKRELDNPSFLVVSKAGVQKERLRDD